MSKLTKEQMQGMSDFEVNKALAIAQGKYAGEVGDWMPNGVKVNDESGFFYSEMNYCKTPNDIMPLAFEHKISLVYGERKNGEDGWIAIVGVENLLEGINTTAPVFANKNPLRAIACCLILVLQEGK